MPHSTPHAPLRSIREILSSMVSSPSGHLSTGFFTLEQSRKLLISSSCLNRLLTDKERLILSSFKLEKRQHEWLAGRLSAKLAVHRITCIPRLNTIEISNSETGRPLLFFLSEETEKNLPPFISISHSGEIACAVASDTACGIDIQKMKSSILKVKERFCSAEEEQLLQHIPPAHSLRAPTMLWSAKEALRKMLSDQFLPEFLAMHLSKVEKESHLFAFTFSISGLPYPIRVICSHVENYAIALCTARE